MALDDVPGAAAHDARDVTHTEVGTARSRVGRREQKLGPRRLAEPEGDADIPEIGRVDEEGEGDCLPRETYPVEEHGAGAGIELAARADHHQSDRPAPGGRDRIAHREWPQPVGGEAR